MIKHTRLITTASENPYHNLALEELLMESNPPECCTLYLWQNRQTVVIGQNQNAWQECRVKELEEDGGHLARRLSGGGAVFHDLGNLNFTFLVPRADYDVARQTQVIQEAAASFGLTVERSGRNDILVEGRKFSGNAFYKKGQNAYHHGTILIDVDMGALGRYLNVQPDKLQSKGVRSVRSRVANLREFSQAITVETMKQRLEAAFEKVYGGPVEKLREEDLDQKALEALEEKYASFQWRLGKKIPFDKEIAGRFPWGGVKICLGINGGRVEKARIFSDAMDSECFPQLEQALIGLPYSSAALLQAIRPLLPQKAGELGYEMDGQMGRDLCSLLEGESF